MFISYPLKETNQRCSHEGLCNFVPNNGGFSLFVVIMLSVIYLTESKIFHRSIKRMSQTAVQCMNPSPVPLLPILSIHNFGGLFGYSKKGAHGKRP